MQHKSLWRKAFDPRGILDDVEPSSKNDLPDLERGGWNVVPEPGNKDLFTQVQQSVAERCPSPDRHPLGQKLALQQHQQSPESDDERLIEPSGDSSRRPLILEVRSNDENDTTVVQISLSAENEICDALTIVERECIGNCSNFKLDISYVRDANIFERAQFYWVEAPYIPSPTQEDVSAHYTESYCLARAQLTKSTKNRPKIVAGVSITFGVTPKRRKKCSGRCRDSKVPSPDNPKDLQHNTYLVVILCDKQWARCHVGHFAGSRRRKADDMDPQPATPNLPVNSTNPTPGTAKYCRIEPRYYPIT